MNDARPRTPPDERFDAASLVFDLPAEIAALRQEGPAKHGQRQKALFKGHGRTVALFVLDAGAGLPEHKAAGTVTIQPIEGEITVTADNATRRLRCGQIVLLAPNVKHAVSAQGAAAFLLQVSLAGA